MNRIEKYQNSIEKFIINRTDKIDKNIFPILKNNNYFITIFIIIILSVINKKNKQNNNNNNNNNNHNYNHNHNHNHNHCYYISSSMELLQLITINSDKIDNNTMAKITSLINLLILDNYNISSNILSKDKLIKHYNLVYKNINLFILNNNNNNNYNILYKLIAEITCYLFGCNTNTIFAYISLSNYYSNIIKFYYDINNFSENNLKNIINELGIHKSFEFYISNKKKFIEIALKLKITSNTLYDILEIIEYNFENFIEKYKNIIL